MARVVPAPRIPGRYAVGSMGRDADALVVIATHLRPEEAGMLRGLLESAGIAAVVRDDVLSGVHPFLQPAIGGAKLAVPAGDAERAFEIVNAAGVLPGPPPDEPVEIPEQEWSAPAAPAVAGAPLGRAPSRSPRGRRAVIAASIVAALAALWRCGMTR
jgi:hypothetical protein